MILQNAFAVLVALFSFGLIVMVHEFGHFYVAKRVGICVHEFAFGFGPRIFGVTRGETTYNWRLFPFGGFVRMEGEDEGELDPNDPRSFLSKSYGAKMAVLSGGIVLNYASALIALLLVGFVYGIPTFAPSSVVGAVVEGQPAERAGLRVKDRIVAVEGKPCVSFEDVLHAIQPRPGQPTRVSVQRDGATFEVSMVPVEGTLGGRKVGRIGVAPGAVHKIEFTPAEGSMQVFEMAGMWVTRVTTMPFEIVYQLLRGERKASEVKEGMAGPIAIGQMFHEIYYMGFGALLFFWGFISASVGATNIVPIPALDGARMLFLSLGALRGRPIDPRKEGWVHLGGFVVLLALMLLFSVQDVQRLIKGVKFFSLAVLGAV